MTRYARRRIARNINYCYCFLWLLSLFIHNSGCLGQSPNDVISAIAASPNGQTVYVISRGLLLHSIDGGLSWQLSMPGMSCIQKECGNYDEIFVELIPNEDDMTIFYGTNKYGLLQSSVNNDNDDSGHYSSWKPVGSKLFTHCPGKGHLASPPNNNLLLVVGESKNNNGSFYLYRSEDGGDTFEEIRSLQLDGCACVYSASPSVFFVGGSYGDVWASLDGGKVWTMIPSVLPDIDEWAEDTDNQILQIVGVSSTTTHVSTDDTYEIYVLTKKTLVAATLVLKNNGNVIKLGSSHILQETSRISFLNAVAYPSGASSAATTSSSSISLVLMKSGCNMDPKCHQDLFLSHDKGETWKSDLRASTLTNKFGNGHYGIKRLDQTFFDEEFYDAWGNENILFLGSFQGVFRSDDHGVSWTYLDTISHWITGLSVGRGFGKDWFLLDFCTYTRGCFGGRIKLSEELLEANTDGVSYTNNMQQMIEPLRWARPNTTQEGFEILAVSPHHELDGLVLRSTYINDNEFRLERTFRNFYNSTFVKIPPLDPDGDNTVIHSFAFVTQQNKDWTIFLSGHNIGLCVSQDAGQTFELLWDPRTVQINGTITKIALSPDFSNDSTMVVLVDNYAAQGRVYHLEFNAHVYLSQDRGSTWTRLTQVAQPWTNLVMVRSKTDELRAITVHTEGSLYDCVEAEGCQRIASSILDPSLSEGYSINGVATSPDGYHLVAALDGGGLIRFDHFDPTINDFEFTLIISATQLPQDMKFVYNFRPNWLRGIGDIVDFSPDFADDQLIVAASFYSIYASFDKGLHWHEVYRLPHYNTKTWSDKAVNDVERTTYTPMHHLLAIFAAFVIGMVVVWTTVHPKEPTIGSVDIELAHRQFRNSNWRGRADSDGDTASEGSAGSAGEYQNEFQDVAIAFRREAHRRASECQEDAVED